MGLPPHEVSRSVGMDNLALLFQELITATIRLRSGDQQVSDVGRFREQVLQALRSSTEAARNKGYTSEDAQLAAFAVVAFLDESILNLRLSEFAEWVRRPLQEELFGQHVAGETFFRNLDVLLGRADTPELADALEVYQLCMLLGYQGKYSLLARGELRALLTRTADKIQRIRQTSSDLSPDWEPTTKAVASSSRDPWIYRLRIGAGASVGLALALWVIYELLLSSGARALREAALQGGRF